MLDKGTEFLLASNKSAKFSNYGKKSSCEKVGSQASSFQVKAGCKIGQSDEARGEKSACKSQALA